jgi:hypothetical protein
MGYGDEAEPCSKMQFHTSQGFLAAIVQYKLVLWIELRQHLEYEVLQAHCTLRVQ